MTFVKSSILGFVVGDTLGVPFEGKRRGTYIVSGMSSFGTHFQPLGTWSDDTSMTLATMDSIIENSGNIVPDDIMKRFVKWYDDAEYTATDEVFDVGNTTRDAIEHYMMSVEFCCSEKENGNGALMRMLPLALCGASDKMVDSVSGLTHNHEISKICCKGYVHVVKHLLQSGILDFSVFDFGSVSKNIQKIETLDVSDIRSSGYVVDTLESAFWCAKTTNNYRDCVLKAVNLGGDTDTIAAIAGGIAGIMYGIGGECGVPEEWISCIMKRDWIEKLCDSFRNFVFCEV